MRITLPNTLIFGKKWANTRFHLVEGLPLDIQYGIRYLRCYLKCSAKVWTLILLFSKHRISMEYEETSKKFLRCTLWYVEEIFYAVDKVDREIMCFEVGRSWWSVWKQPYSSPDPHTPSPNSNDYTCCLRNSDRRHRVLRYTLLTLLRCR
jgi:hypothetical protein